MAEDTKARLRAAAIETLKREGISGTSARAIAKTGDLNQALIFYHYGSVDDLLIAATEESSEQRVTLYRERLAEVSTLRELVGVARVLYEEERELQNVTVLTQMLAGGVGDEKLGPPTLGNVRRWSAEVEAALNRVLDESAFADLIDTSDLAYAISAMFLGIELLAHLEDDLERDRQLFTSLERMALLVEALMALGPVATRALRRKLDTA